MKVFVHILLFSILFSVYAKLHICINYVLNQRYYAEVLCVNKAVKKSCCKGKCAMQKELTDLTKKEDQQPGRSGTSLLKIIKSGEGLPSSFEFKGYYHLVSVVSTEPNCRTRGQHPPVLLRPPVAGCVTAVNLTATS